MNTYMSNSALVLAAVKTQLEAGVELLERAKANLRVLGLDGDASVIAESILAARRALYKTDHRIKSLQKIQKL